MLAFRNVTRGRFAPAGALPPSLTCGLIALPSPQLQGGILGDIRSNRRMLERAPRRVLVFGDDMRIFLAVVRSLGRAGMEVHAAPFNWHAPALASKYIAAVHRLPRYPDDPEGWLDSVQELLRSHAFDLVIPCDDRAIFPLHLHREALAGTRLAIPDSNAMQLLFDKEATRALCRELSIPVVDGARLAAGDSAAELAARFGLPLVVKPRQSYWIDRLDSWGRVFIVDTEVELAALLP